MLRGSLFTIFRESGLMMNLWGAIEDLEIESSIWMVMASSTRLHDTTLYIQVQRRFAMESIITVMLRSMRVLRFPMRMQMVTVMETKTVLNLEI